MNGSKYDYMQRPQQFDRTDFWRQVRRTINGQPVDEIQIKFIVDQILSVLDLQPTDHLMDIGCGNGALTSYLEPYVAKLHGMDHSEYLIEIALEYFSSEKSTFELKNIENAIGLNKYKEFNKVLIYGVSSFLSDDTLQKLLTWYFNDNNRSMMLGNIRDREYASKFYGRNPSAIELDDISSSMGKWRERTWFENLANEQGIVVSFFKMPNEFYASEYYFDVLFSKD